MLVGAAFGLYPYALVARGDAQFGLTISNAAAAEYGLRAGGVVVLSRGWCWWWGILFLPTGDLRGKTRGANQQGQNEGDDWHSHSVREMSIAVGEHCYWRYVAEDGARQAQAAY